MPRSPYPITKDQVPVLAKCLIGNRLGRVSFIKNTSSNPSVAFQGSGLNLELSLEDWRKVLPLLPEPYWSQPSVVFLDGVGLGSDLSLIDFSDLYLYERVVADLLPLFPAGFNTGA